MTAAKSADLPELRISQAAIFALTLCGITHRMNGWLSIQMHQTGQQVMDRKGRMSIKVKFSFFLRTLLT